MESIVKVVLDYFKVDYTSSFLHSHGSLSKNETLFSILIILNKYRLGAKGIRFNDKYNLNQENLPLLCFVSGNPYLVVSINSESAILLSSNNKENKMSTYSFFEAWNGTGLIFSEEATAYASEPNYKQHKKLEIIRLVKRTSIALLSIIACVIFITRFSGGLWRYVTMVINILGMGTTFLLLQKQLHISNKLTDKICALSKKSDCEKVASSSGSSLFGLFKFSEIGFAFFTINSLCLIVSPSYRADLALYAVLTLPFSAWSIWYQKFRIKSWCPLCLITISFMWIQALAYICWIGNQPSSLSWANCILIGCLYAISIIGANLSMSYIVNNEENKVWKHKFDYLRFDNEVISVKKGEKRILIDDINCSSLVFGNPDAPVEVTVYSNPYCAPCADAHEKLASLPGDYIKIRYVMTYFSESKSVINKFIIAAYHTLGWEQTWRLMTEWYSKGKKQGASFFDDLNLNIDNMAVETEFEKHEQWRNFNHMTGTPTSILNGVSIEWPYDVEDIPYIV